MEAAHTVHEIVSTAGISFLTCCLLIISAGAWNWKPGSHRVRAGKCCPETPRAAARLRERDRDWHEFDIAAFSASSSSSAWPDARFPQTDCVIVWQGFIFRSFSRGCHNAAASIVTLCPSHRVEYIRLQLDLHSNAILMHQGSAFMCIENTREDRLRNISVLWQSSLHFCTCILFVFQIILTLNIDLSERLRLIQVYKHSIGVGLYSNRM